MDRRIARILQNSPFRGEFKYLLILPDVEKHTKKWEIVQRHLPSFRRACQDVRLFMCIPGGSQDDLGRRINRRHPVAALIMHIRMVHGLCVMLYLRAESTTDEAIIFLDKMFTEINLLRELRSEDLFTQLPPESPSYSVSESSVSSAVSTPCSTPRSGSRAGSPTRQRLRMARSRLQQSQTPTKRALRFDEVNEKGEDFVTSTEPSWEEISQKFEGRLKDATKRQHDTTMEEDMDSSGSSASGVNSLEISFQIEYFNDHAHFASVTPREEDEEDGFGTPCIDPSKPQAFLDIASALPDIGGGRKFFQKQPSVIEEIPNEEQQFPVGKEKDAMIKRVINGEVEEIETESEPESAPANVWKPEDMPQSSPKPGKRQQFNFVEIFSPIKQPEQPQTPHLVVHTSPIYVTPIRQGLPRVSIEDPNKDMVFVDEEEFVETEVAFEAPEIPANISWQLPSVEPNIELAEGQVLNQTWASFPVFVDEPEQSHIEQNVPVPEPEQVNGEEVHVEQIHVEQAHASHQVDQAELEQQVQVEHQIETQVQVPEQAHASQQVASAWDQPEGIRSLLEDMATANPNDPVLEHPIRFSESSNGEDETDDDEHVVPGAAPRRQRAPMRRPGSRLSKLKYQTALTSIHRDVYRLRMRDGSYKLGEDPFNNLPKKSKPVDMMRLLGIDQQLSPIEIALPEGETTGIYVPLDSPEPDDIDSEDDEAPFDLDSDGLGLDMLFGERSENEDSENSWEVCAHITSDARVRGKGEVVVRAEEVVDGDWLYQHLTDPLHYQKCDPNKPLGPNKAPEFPKRFRYNRAPIVSATVMIHFPDWHTRRHPDETPIPKLSAIGEPTETTTGPIVDQAMASASLSSRIASADGSTTSALDPHTLSSITKPSTVSGQISGPHVDSVKSISSLSLPPLPPLSETEERLMMTGIPEEGEPTVLPGPVPEGPPQEVGGLVIEAPVAQMPEEVGPTTEGALQAPHEAAGPAIEEAGAQLPGAGPMTEGALQAPQEAAGPAIEEAGAPLPGAGPMTEGAQQPPHEAAGPAIEGAGAPLPGAGPPTEGAVVPQPQEAFQFAVPRRPTRTRRVPPNYREDDGDDEYQPPRRVRRGGGRGRGRGRRRGGERVAAEVPPPPLEDEYDMMMDVGERPVHIPHVEQQMDLDDERPDPIPRVKERTRLWDVDRVKAYLRQKMEEAGSRDLYFSPDCCEPLYTDRKNTASFFRTLLVLDAGSFIELVQNDVEGNPYKLLIIGKDSLFDGE